MRHVGAPAAGRPGPVGARTSLRRVQCDYFDAGECRSCTWMGRPYADQLADTDRAAREALAGAVDPAGAAWLPPVPSVEEGFRSKAKMVVGGTVEAPTLGILDRDRRGVDLRRCGLHTAGLRAALPVLAEFVARAGLTPYDVPSRRGELKHVIATEAPDGGLMVRWVLRTTEAEPRIRKHLAWLRERLDGLGTPLVVASVNLQPEHKAVLEGPEERVLTEAATLPMRLGVAGGRRGEGADVTLQLRPRSFFQTNTGVAARLYAEARSWVAGLGVGSVWDLYCGVGGFALHLADVVGGPVTGVEVSEEAVASARASAAEAGLAARFEAADATAWTLAHDPADAPDLVVVNPPRRGIGADLAGWLERYADAGAGGGPGSGASSTPPATPAPWPATWRPCRRGGWSGRGPSTCFRRPGTTRSWSCSPHPSRRPGVN